MIKMTSQSVSDTLRAILREIDDRVAGTSATLVRARMRRRAVFCCLYFGILPWWIYERTCHYGPRDDGSRGLGYLRHLTINLRRAVLWACGSPSDHEVDFELRVNTRPNWTRWHRSER
jgi:hypothetical protein